MPIKKKGVELWRCFCPSSFKRSVYDTMFENNYYVTSGVATRVPPYLQSILSYLVEIMEVTIKDHLQVFELEEVNDKGQIKQRIIHKQKQPLYMTEHLISVKEAVTEKVFLIDDGSSSTMLLEEEY